MVSVKNLSKNYGEHQAVSDLNFDIGCNSVVGLLGPNGAGKSTTMRMLTGFLAPSSGSVSVCGISIVEEPVAARRNIGYLPEIPPLYPDMTVREHLGFVCGLRDVRNSAAETDRVCRELNISDVSGRMIRHLSKGYRQRVGFAAALVGSPSFLVLDEPTVGLDPEQIIEIRDLIRRLSKEMSILISSHMLGEISSVCDSLLILRKGRLIAAGSREQIEASARKESRLEVCVRGDAGQIELLLGKAAPGARIEHMDSKNDEHRYILSGAPDADYRPAVFTGFAEQRDTLALLTMRSMDKSLEEVFLDIIKE